MTHYVEKFLKGNGNISIDRIEIKVDFSNKESSSFPFSKLIKLIKEQNNVEEEYHSETSAKQTLLLRIIKALIDKLKEKEDGDIQMSEVPPLTSPGPSQPTQTYTVLQENLWIKPKKKSNKKKKSEVGSKKSIPKDFPKPQEPKTHKRVSTSINRPPRNSEWRYIWPSLRTYWLKPDDGSYLQMEDKKRLIQFLASNGWCIEHWVPVTGLNNGIKYSTMEKIKAPNSIIFEGKQFSFYNLSWNPNTLVINRLPMEIRKAQNLPSLIAEACMNCGCAPPEKILTQ